jgi:C-terminal processing protease CtpA/Prc
VFDENDSIKDKNLYCLISPVSFSCGNYVPALLKASDKVTLIGKKSSGGGCIVNNGVLADGTLFGISDAKQMSIVKNGTYYSVDGGVEPHVELTKIESFYNREALTEYINYLK